ncbi:T9SS type A sorting domain-containing protein [Polaribacter sp. IC073]|uniref:T9SS type A sorting domain-containing protein n=1 Tax=Polaribacter sp. IC073 TaxID=2508540 RepID=UPI0011BEEF33|nr:T9SS type A sorting domain-containing protein [Polaribacter sp. IC073]TXD49087.1 T9SS type A sorting domain-containing protein [Polaribacter sp. IC073]
MAKKLFFICLYMCLFQIQSSSAQWEIVGEDYAGAHQNQQLKIDGDDNVYLAYTNVNNDDKITVKKRDVNTDIWEVIGVANFSSAGVSNLNLSIYNNVPYLAYRNGNNELEVVKFDVTTWVSVGSPNILGSNVRSLSLAIDNLGIPYVAFVDDTNSLKTTVIKFVDASWSLVGAEGFTIGKTASLSLAIDSNNLPYVAYQMTGTDYSRRAYVSLFNGTSWEFVKTGNIDYASLEEYTNYLSLVIDSNDKLFLALSEGGGQGGENVVLTHDGTAWSYYGSNFGDPVTALDLVMGNDNVLYEVYRDVDSNYNNRTNVVYNDPANPGWNFINPTLPNAVNDFAYGQQIAVDSNGTLFIAYQDSEFNKAKTSVYKFSKTPYANWTNVSADTSTDFSFSNEVEVLNSAISPNGVPYISYLDNNKVTVAKFDGTEWASVGIPNFETTGFATFFGVESGVFVDRNNVPYVFFNYLENAPDFNSGPPSDFPVFKLLKFDGTNWVAATTTEEVGSGANGVFSVDNNNNIYFASTTYDYSSGSPVISTTIQKYNGSIWTTLDNTLTSSVVTLLNDSNDSLYVGSWSDEDDKYSLFKFNGVSLEILGTALQISSFDRSENSVTMKLDSNNVPYISYLEGKKVVIKKINATSDGWDDINVVDLPINITGLSFDLDTANTPYVVYKDVSNETSVRKFNGASSQWDLLGVSNFTFGVSNNLKITLDYNNIPYVIYKDESRGDQPRIFSYLTNTSITSTATTLAWNDPTIWGDRTVPTKTSRVTIPAGKTVIIDDVTSAVAGSITIEGVLEFNSSNTSSSTLITQTDPIGKIAFKRDVLGDKKWHVVAAPLTQNKDIFAGNNALETGQGNNRGIGFYNDGNTGWTYYQDGTTNSEDFNFGDAYSVLLSDASELQLEGSATASPVHKVLSKNTTGWNLVGNPYLAFLPINVSGNATNNILDNNDAVFQTGFKSLYLWNNATEDYTVVNQANTTTTFVSPGQGFFINAKNNGDLFKIDPTMRSHETAVFFKSSKNPFVIELEAKTGDVVKKSQIKYFENSTKDLDEGYDAGQFSGGLTSKGAIRLFTKLVEDTSNLDIDLALQVLPTSSYEEMVIPIGLEVKNTVEVTLKATISQLPADYKVFLEDKKEHKFYRLDTNSKGYTTEVTSSDKKGRFYLHTTTVDLTKTLGVVNENFLNATVFVAAENVLTVNGLNSKNTTLEIFNLLGKQVFTKHLQDTKAAIDLNRLAKGFYIVKLKSKAQKEISKKIIIK